MIPWTENWDEARERSKESGKPIHLFLHAPT
jgi:hypothetical protein